MGLIGGIYNMVRQSEEDEFKKRITEQRLMQDQAKFQREQAAYDKSMNAREAVYGGLQELAEIDTRIQDNDFKKKLFEQRMQGGSPEDVSNASLQIMLLSKENERLQKLSSLREAEMHYKTIDAGYAKAKALDLVDAMNGIKSSKESSTMATVRRKQVVGTDEEGNPIEETVTMKVPQENVSGYQNQNTSEYGYNQGVADAALRTAGSQYLPQLGGSGMMDQVNRTADYVNSGGSVMFSPNQPEISAPAQQSTMQAPVAATPMQSSDEKTMALNAYNKAQTPEAKEKIRQTAASRGIQIP